MIDDLLLQCKILAALLQWNNLRVSEQLWIKGSEQNKPHLKTEMKEVQKLLDIQVQAAKRKFKFKFEACSSDPRVPLNNDMCIKYTALF